MVVALILVSIALAACLGLLFFGPNRADAIEKAQAKAAQEAKERSHLQAELERKRKELEEQRSAFGDLREQLRLAKKKLHDQREGDKDGRDLVRARLDVERQASQQLEAVRAELASALTELERARSDAPGPRGRRESSHAPSPVPAAPLASASSSAVSNAPVVAPPPASPPPQIVRTVRELSPAEKEKMDRLEHQANKDRARSVELEKELKKLKGRVETQNRVYVVTKGELDLLKDKFRAVEKRLNRTLLERDLVKRAIVALEKKTGVAAERTEPTADEFAASDRHVEEQAQAEASAIAHVQNASSTPMPRSDDTPQNGASGEHAEVGQPPSSSVTS